MFLNFTAYSPSHINIGSQLKRWNLFVDTLKSVLEGCCVKDPAIGSSGQNPEIINIISDLIVNLISVLIVMMYFNDV